MKEQIITYEKQKQKMTEKITATKPVMWTWHFSSCPIENQLWFNFFKVGCDDQTWKQQSIVFWPCCLQF